jgi:hypothetical protein
VNGAQIDEAGLRLIELPPGNGYHLAVMPCRWRIFLSLLVGVALAAVGSANPVLGLGNVTYEGCCHTHDNGKSETQDEPCDSGNCPMPCCRMATAFVDPLPAKKSAEAVTQAVAVPTNLMHSLTDTNAIFHPPRA